MSGTLMRSEEDLLRAAAAGEERALRELLEPRRSELTSHCYRMLGSLHDAEDAMQEVWLRAWRSLGGYEGRSSLRAWLYRIATNVCLTQIERRPRRVLPIDFGPASDPRDGVFEPLAESVWVEPYPDARLGMEDGLTAPEASIEQRESVELAFVAALQHLPPIQRAALVLREVLGFSAREVADALETTTASVNSALQRARKLVDERLPDRTQQSALRALGDEELRSMVESYMRALEEGDTDGVIALLTEDAAWSMPPTPVWYRGHDEIRTFLTESAFVPRWRHLLTQANGQPAVAGYVWDEDSEVYGAFVIDVLTVRDGRIADVTAFIDSALFPRFGLPPELPAVGDESAPEDGS